MLKRKILVIGSTERLRRRVMNLLGELSDISVSGENDLTDIEIYFSEHRFDVVLLECNADFEQSLDRLRRFNPMLPIIVYDTNPDHAKTRAAFLAGALDVLKIHGITADDLSEILERAQSPQPRSIAEEQYQIRNIRSIIHRGQSFMLQLMDGKPPSFYMNGNRATLLRANVLCLQPTALWQQEATWVWIHEFGAANTFLFESEPGQLRLAAMIEQDYVNTASFKRMLNTQLEHCYSQFSAMNCVCVATHCSSDYLSLSMMHMLDSIADLVFYMNECQTLPASPTRLNASFPSQLFSEFCSAVAMRDSSGAIACIDRAVVKLRNDLPDPNFARAKLSRFIWEMASVLGSHSDQEILTSLDDSHIRPLRDSIVALIRSALASEVAVQPASPLDALIHRIEVNPGLPINIDQAAEEINFSRSHFCRLFRQQTGQSFTAFLTQKRINRACELLKKTSMRVDEVSDIVGISNSWYFKKLFQKETGVSVEDWISQNRNNDAPPDLTQQ